MISIVDLLWFVLVPSIVRFQRRWPRRERRRHVRVLLFFKFSVTQNQRRNEVAPQRYHSARLYFRLWRGVSTSHLRPLQCFFPFPTVSDSATIVRIQVKKTLRWPSLYHCRSRPKSVNWVDESEERGWVVDVMLNELRFRSNKQILTFWIRDEQPPFRELMHRRLALALCIVNADITICWIVEAFSVVPSGIIPLVVLVTTHQVFQCK